MLRNYLKIAFRSLWRSKVHSFINILGLSLGIGCCILIILFVKDEWTFDTFHSKSERIFRMYVKEDWGENQQFFNTVTPFPLGPLMKDNFPEIEHQVRINKMGVQVKVGDNQYTETVTIAGQDFFEVFDFEVLSGDRETALRDQRNIVISRWVSEKYFGKEDPLGKVISVQLGEKFEDFTVKAVTARVPVNSSI